MIKAEAIKNGDGVEVKTEVEGMGGDIIEEALSIVKHSVKDSQRGIAIWVWSSPHS